MSSNKSRGMRIAGFRVTIDPLLPVVIILIGWLLSVRYFPAYTIGYVHEVNYILGGIASLMLTFSILFHELGHAIAAVRARLRIDRIHLLLFGGMAELKHRPVTGFQELIIALCGPLASFLLAGIAYGILFFLPLTNSLISLVLQFVAHINVLLGLFNLIPIFPLDGGRAIRAFLWQMLGRYYQASQVTLYVSYVLIGAMFLIGFADMLLIKSGYQLIILLLAAYLSYTVYNGRKELIHKPEFIDLLYRVENQHNLPETINQIVNSDETYLRRTILPVVHQDGTLVSVVNGGNLHNYSVSENKSPTALLPHEIEHLIMEPQLGFYIDLSESDSFATRIEYNSDFVPVLQKGQFLGLCDAYEMRFWLNEKEFYSVNKPYDPTDCIPESYRA
ncbi:MAG: site-2 protease family protein [Balneolales bacterium]|nr:site-2 protease family protein [Balneolales bacterium]